MEEEALAVSSGAMPGPRPCAVIGRRIGAVCIIPGRTSAGALNGKRALLAAS